MIARTELEIIWDGPVKGLAEHRISLAKFAVALDLLMKAARRIASQKLQDALEPTSTGRLAAASTNLDIEITGVKGNSSGFSTVITFEVPDSSGQELLFNQLPELVGLELLESIESEAKGTLRNTAVRKYLGALPRELTRQNYNLHENGRAIREVNLSTVSLANIPDTLPAFISQHGRIAGVGFDPRWEVRVRGEGGAQVTALATEKQVNMALKMRSQEVDVLAVSSAAGNRLVVIENDEMRKKRPTLDELFDKWEETFRALA